MGEMKGTEVFFKTKISFYSCVCIKFTESDFFAEYHSCRYISFSSFDSFVLKEAGFICTSIVEWYCT